MREKSEKKSATENVSVEFVAHLRIGAKGQVTIPPTRRAALGWEPGMPMLWLRLEAGLLVLPAERHCMQLAARIRHALARRDVTAAEILASRPQARQRVHARRYPELAQTEPTKTRQLPTPHPSA